MSSSFIRRPAARAKVIEAARGWLGTPYHDQASVKGVGADCLGLLRGVWREVVGEEPMPTPPYSRGWGETDGEELLRDAARAVMVEIAPEDAAPSAVLLFRMRERGPAKHAGIIAERGQTFMHAYERLGVIEEPLTRSWRRRVAHAFFFPRRAG